MRQQLRRALVAAASVAVVAVAGCARADPPDTEVVVLAEGLAGVQPWRLEGRRVDGTPCAFLVLVGLDRPPVERCGTRRTLLRHLEPATVVVWDRHLVFSPLPASARRVRLDTFDGAIRTEPASQAPGFPARFFLVELDLDNPLVTARVFGEGGRAVVS